VLHNAAAVQTAVRDGLVEQPAMIVDFLLDFCHNATP
jgi:hypothetical protein